MTYSPTNVTSEDEVTDYFNELNKTVKSIPAHNFLTIAGDFNSRIGLDNAKFAYHEQTNRNGEFLLEFVQENNLVITNTTFRRKLQNFGHVSYQVDIEHKLGYIRSKKVEE